MNNLNTNEINEWLVCFDSSSNFPYYYNTITGISQWELPSELNSLPSSTSSPLPSSLSLSSSKTTSSLSSNHFFSPPGGLRPLSSIDSPPILKLKTNSKLKLSFRGQNKIIPIINDIDINDNSNNNSLNSSNKEEDNNYSNSSNNSIIVKNKFTNLTDQPQVEQRKQRPTVKLKGESLQNLKRVSSNNQLNNNNATPSITTTTQEDDNKETLQSYSFISTEVDPQHYLTYNQYSSPVITTTNYKYTLPSQDEFISSQSLSNQHQPDYYQQQQQPQQEDYNYYSQQQQDHHHHQQQQYQQNTSNPHQSQSHNHNPQSSSTLSRDYLALAKTYKQHLPYLHHHFDPKIKCVLCYKEIPIDILFPCGHRCVCRECLNLPPFEQQSSSASTSAAAAASSSVNKHKKVPCPLCNLIIKKIIPINEDGTEEIKYWDSLTEAAGEKSKTGGLSEDFFLLFQQNIQILKSQMNVTNNKNEFSDIINDDNLNGSMNNPSDENNNTNNTNNNNNGGYNENEKLENIENNDNNESSEEKSKQIESFPQFSEEKKDICCNIQ